MKDKDRAEERSKGVVSQLFRYMHFKRFFILLLCLSLLCAPIFGMTASANDSVIVRVGYTKIARKSSLMKRVKRQGSGRTL